MEQPVTGQTIKKEILDVKKEIDVKTEHTTNSQNDKDDENDEENEDERPNILDLDRANFQNGEMQTVVLGDLQIDGELAIIGNIISQSNSDGNLRISTLEEDIIHTYIINNAEYEEVEGETVVYEGFGDGENSIEYIIEESVEYEELQSETSESITYTQVQEMDDEHYEYVAEESIEENATDEDTLQGELLEAEVVDEERLEETEEQGFEVPEDEGFDDPEQERYENDDVHSDDQMVIDQEEKDPEIKEEHLECDMCNKVFKTTAGLKRHITVNHDKTDETDLDDPLTLQLCPCCGEPWDSAHTIGDYKCDHCDKLFVQINFLQRHLSIEHPKNNEYVCVICRKPFETKEALVEHMWVHPVKTVKCLDCNREFTRKYHLDRHIGQTGCMGQPRKVFDCRVCKRCFTRKDNLAEHLRNHAGQIKKKKTYSCEFCDKEFQGYTLLSIHVRTHTGEKPFKCDLCPKRFPSGGAMKKHRRMHTGEKPYRCDHCDKTFAAKETLNRHTRTHTGEKPHRCKFCGKAFIQPSQLRAHIFHHTGENAYSCQYCGRAFNRKLRLTNHIKFMHEGAEPLPCPHCDKTFFRKEDVARHMLSHSGLKPFACEICDKAFAVKSSLKIHMNIHRKEPPCSCETCGRAFIRRDCLMRHIRARHRDVLEDILANAEKKRLQQQLLTAATECASGNLTENVVWNELTLTESIKELLTLLVDEDCLLEFGYPDAPVDKICDKAFAVKSSLKIHMNIHRKEPPCSCETCGRAFIRRDCLMRHIRARHRDVLEDILANAEKKRLQQQLLTAATECASGNLTENVVWNELTLTESIKELLTLLVDEDCLLEFGYPDAPVDKVLDSVIRRCGHTPASEDDFDYIGRIRENAKLLFTVVIDDGAVKELLNNQTVDEVILHVLRLAKKQKENS